MMRRDMTDFQMKKKGKKGQCVISSFRMHSFNEEEEERKEGSVCD
jgi:hypothetical protein